jgi:GT2 family glycosyltransferase
VAADGSLGDLPVTRVLIVLVNWNGWHDTLECLESLLLLEYPCFRVVVCDNGSTDDSLLRLIAWVTSQEVSFVEYSRTEAESGVHCSTDPFLTIIRNGENLGFAGGNNVGLRYGMAREDIDYFWLLNNDTVVEPDALTHLMDSVKLRPEIGICGSSIRLYHKRENIQALGGGYYCSWIGLPWHYGRFTRWNGDSERLRRAESKMNYVEGASMLVSRKFVDVVGLLCEDYFLFFEEADWAMRAKGRFKLGYAPQSIVYHKVGGSIGTNSSPAKMSYLCDYFNIRNRIFFTRRFYPAALPTVYLTLFGSLVLRIVLGKWDRAVMILKMMFRFSADFQRPL